MGWHGTKPSGAAPPAVVVMTRRVSGGWFATTSTSPAQDTGTIGCEGGRAPRKEAYGCDWGCLPGAIGVCPPKGYNTLVLAPGTRSIGSSCSAVLWRLSASSSAASCSSAPAPNEAVSARAPKLLPRRTCWMCEQNNKWVRSRVTFSKGTHVIQDARWARGRMPCAHQHQLNTRVPNCGVSVSPARCWT